MTTATITNTNTPAKRTYTRRNVVKSTRLGVSIVTSENDDGDMIVNMNLMGNAFRSFDPRAAADLATFLENDVIPFLRNFVRANPV